MKDFAIELLKNVSLWSTLLGALTGSFFAYKLNLRKEERNRMEKELAVLNALQQELISFFNSIGEKMEYFYDEESKNSKIGEMNKLNDMFKEIEENHSPLPEQILQEFFSQAVGFKKILNSTYIPTINQSTEKINFISRYSMGKHQWILNLFKIINDLIKKYEDMNNCTLHLQFNFARDLQTFNMLRWLVNLNENVIELTEKCFIWGHYLFLVICDIKNEEYKKIIKRQKKIIIDLYDYKKYFPEDYKGIPEHIKKEVERIRKKYDLINKREKN